MAQAALWRSKKRSKTFGAALLTAAFLFALMLSSARAGSSDQAEVWKKAEMNAQLTKLVGQAKTSGLAEATLGNYSGHAVRLLVRTADGQAEVHGHSSDVIVVTQGQVSLITGGTVVNPKAGENGEIRGTGIQGGLKRSISVGDVVHIPPGTPHQMLVQRGTTFHAVLIKVQE